ncbi:hypothetical protein CWI42_040520 [Ordospora colligata]|uniref:5'-3' DNA helicase ZGRF1-like N-terminal domain-containing protein n=1 Tax=Ordospora colligata OC4 TaxID=1354746 RepID=A0A0B2UKU6_9MICR|nr:uncharacterized protein M896_040520 [Ordospora colligata OC4]KHN69859.1 hypothetical protein M896_040520 [Ordospora colligata OC4]TBU16029.1 hypothetical protein CWI41_040520 [Ordospora colligata]TBU16242.1 hypothetical protein CWI40_040520 [Ordospora colligata]TBU18946.1 hypothetical protein CWI42_040520 [Ordospora colligata]
MIRCTYTSQKHKKQKLWLDGFVSLKGKKVSLYDSEKKVIESSFVLSVENDMEMQKYLVYVDSFEDLENECIEPDDKESKSYDKIGRYNNSYNADDKYSNSSNTIDKYSNVTSIKDKQNDISMNEDDHNMNKNIIHSNLNKTSSGIEAQEPTDLSRNEEHGCVSKGRSSSEIIDLFRRL